MAHLQYYSYAGVGTSNRERFSYSQAVRVGDTIQCSGQGTLVFSNELPSQYFAIDPEPIVPGGWDPEGKVDRIPTEINQQIDQAFKNVEHNLKDAGGKGWSQVFRVNSYHVPINDEAVAAMSRNFKKWMPDHQPIWTCIGVSRLGEDDMRVEIEVVAHDPDGAKNIGAY